MATGRGGVVNESDMNEIEPRIRPLVDALNATGLVRPFSSCEGHFTLDAAGLSAARPDDAAFTDRQRAEVRFVPAPGVSNGRIETLMAYVLTRFRTQHGLVPVILSGYKQYTPLDDDAVEETFVLELRPFNRFDAPEQKRIDTDRAVEQLTRLLRSGPTAAIG